MNNKFYYEEYYNGLYKGEEQRRGVGVDGSRGERKLQGGGGLFLANTYYISILCKINFAEYFVQNTILI